MGEAWLLMALELGCFTLSSVLQPGCVGCGVLLTAFHCSSFRKKVDHGPFHCLLQWDCGELLTQRVVASPDLIKCMRR